LASKIFFNSIFAHNITSPRFEELDIMLYNPVKEEHVTVCCQLHAGFLLGLDFDPDDEGDMFMQNVSLLSLDCMHIISLKTKPFITTAVRTSDTSLWFVNVYR
jgi:hypothetical protein